VLELRVASLEFHHLLVGAAQGGLRVAASLHVTHGAAQLRDLGVTGGVAGGLL
jgi:hypothetical protein